MKQRAPLLPLAVCLMAGIACRSMLNGWTAGLAVLLVTVVVTALLFRWPRWQTAGIWLSTFVFGMTIGAKRQQLLDVVWPEGPVEQAVFVVEEPVVKERWIVATVRTADGEQKLRLYIQRDGDSEGIKIGDGLVVDTYINKVHARERRYMQCHGFTGQAFVRSYQWQWQALSLSGFSLLRRVRLRFLCWRHQLLQHYLQWGISGEAYGVMAAMTLGEKSHIDAETRETYREVGASHILALSGLHLMIIYGVVSLLVSWRRVRLLSQVLIVLAVWGFALLTGLSPSLLRAASMITVYALLALGYRDRMSVNTLAFVAVVLLIANPLALYDVGFQLSFMAVLSIMLVNPLLYNLIPQDWLMEHRWLRWLWGITTVSLSAQIGTAPLVAYYFGYFSTVFLLANFVVIPLATLVLYLALLMLVVSCWPWGVTVVASVLSAVVLTMNRLLGWMGTLPYSSIDGLSLSVLQVFLLYVVMGCVYVVVSLRYPATRRNG